MLSIIQRGPKYFCFDILGSFSNLVRISTVISSLSRSPFVNSLSFYTQLFYLYPQIFTSFLSFLCKCIALFLRLPSHKIGSFYFLFFNTHTIIKIKNKAHKNEMSGIWTADLWSGKQWWRPLYHATPRISLPFSSFSLLSSV